MNEEERTPMTEEEAILPDGYNGDTDDIFAEPDTWKGAAGDDQPEEEAEPETDPEEPPTTEEEPEQEEVAHEEPRKIRFKAKVNHEDQDVEIGEEDLPTLYQKAQVTDRLQAREKEAKDKLDRLSGLAKALHYESVDDMLSATLDSVKKQRVEELLKDHDFPPEIAEDYVSRQIERESQVKTEEEIPPEASPNLTQKDIEHFLHRHPEMVGKNLPDEVFQTIVLDGVSLEVAYADYQTKEAKEKHSVLLRKTKF